MSRGLRRLQLRTSAYGEQMIARALLNFRWKRRKKPRSDGPLLISLNHISLGRGLLDVSGIPQSVLGSCKQVGN